MTTSRSAVCRRFAAAALLLLAATGCESARNISLFSTQQEVELGTEMSTKIESEMKLLNDPAVVNYVKEVGGKVSAQAARQDVEYVFKVIDDPEQVNAFAVPGGNIYIFTGLLTRMSDEAELAAVLAHETAHIDERHSMEALTRQVGYEIVVGAVLGDQAAAWEKILSGVAGNLAFLKFSRSDERQADQIGLELMVKAGYDPQGMVDLLQMFETLAQSQPSAIEIWLSSHPASSERVALVKQQIARENLHGGSVNAEQYQSLVKRIK